MSWTARRNEAGAAKYSRNVRHSTSQSYAQYIQWFAVRLNTGVSGG